MKAYLFIVFTCISLSAVSTQDQLQKDSPKQPKLLKKPRVYTAIVKSDEELIPSQSYPAVAPVIRPFYTGVLPYAPIIVPQYFPPDYGHQHNIKAPADYSEDHAYSNEDYPSRDLTPPKSYQPNTIPYGSSSIDTKQNPAINLTSPQNNDALSYERDLTPPSLEDSYFPENFNEKIESGSALDKSIQLSPPQESPKEDDKQKTSQNAPQVINPFVLQNLFNYQPEDSEIPNVPPPPLPVSNSNSNSTKKKIEYPNAPSNLFAI